MSEAMDKNREQLPNYLEKLRELALNGDREALIYLTRQIMGKEVTRVDITGGEKLGAETLVRLFKILADRRKEMEGGINVIESTGQKQPPLALQEGQEG